MPKESGCLAVTQLPREGSPLPRFILLGAMRPFQVHRSLATDLAGGRPWHLLHDVNFIGMHKQELCCPLRLQRQSWEARQFQPGSEFPRAVPEMVAQELRE